ncbi:hypothetical protein GCM10009821_07500 [Aeromicrobium halocynthiae]|uniref:Uncharacterized protein n=2 Tax=Aeromicrobium halocynthiae TaxID=560557 RepID=A0ABP5HCN1_9ACTN
MAEIVLEDRVHGYLATRVESVAEGVSGRLWWTKWSEPREVIEWLMMRTDETSPLPEYVDGLDLTGDAVEELRGGTLTYIDHSDPDQDRPVTYSLRWLNADDVDVLWDKLGFGSRTLP